MKAYSTVKNPLTVIAIFAGLAEVAGTAVLPFVADAQQSVYIWFLMAFPALLVVLFFLTLNFNPQVLYAPSDFRDEDNYMRIFRPPTAAERRAKAEEERQLESDAETAAALDEEAEPADAHAEEKTRGQVCEDRPRADQRSRAMAVERLVIERLSVEFGEPSMRETAVSTASSTVIFDAFFETSSGGVLVEVKHLGEGSSPRTIMSIWRWLTRSVSSLPESILGRTRLILVVTYEMDSKVAGRLVEELRMRAHELPLPIEIRAYNVDELIDKDLDKH